MEHNKIFNKK